MLTKLGLGKRRIIYTICFFVFCLIDQRVKTGSGLDGWIETFRDLSVAVMAILILSHYQLNDFRKQKIPYLVWSLICVIGGSVFLLRGQSLAYFLNNRIVLLVGVFLLGFAVIQTFIAVVVEHKKPLLDKKFALLWLVMMVLMVLSRSAYVWPLAYLVLFGCFYLTDYTREEQEDLFQGMLNGVILAFFLIQGWCFVFRPYDKVRYVGAYGNCNMNALFYLVVLAAVLSKLLYTYRRNGNKWMRLYYLLGSGCVLAFLYMTISRTGWMVAAVMVLVALVFLGKIIDQGSMIKKILSKGCMLVLCFVLLFPVVFSAVRYLPPVFHHPVWFWGEWGLNKVHSWDAWDSDKYVNLDELMRTSVGRVMEVAESVLGLEAEEKEEKAEADVASTGPRLEVEGVNMAEDSEKEVPQVTPLQQQLYDEAYAAGFALEPEGTDDPFVVRKTIYRYYIHLLNWTGHPESEQGFQIVPDQRIGHAHNIYLQYGVDFGISVMIVFVVLVIWSAIKLVKRFWNNCSIADAGAILFLMVPLLFGLLEFSWGSGSVTIVLLFVMWRRMICDERESEKI